MNTEKSINEEKGNAVLPLVIWRNWLLPFIICLFVAVFFRILFNYLPKNMVTTDFLVGWISCMAWNIARKYYAI